MRTSLAIIGLLLIASASAAAEFGPGTETPIDFAPDGFKTDRASLALPVFVPTDYQPRKASPLILFYHGAGGKPDTGLMQAITGRKGYAVVGMEYLLADDKIVMAVDEQVRFNHHVIKRVSEKVHINPQQVFIGGFSQGGFATALFGFRASEVDTYRGYLEMGGGLAMPGMRLQPFMKDEPVLVLHGDKDPVVPYARGQEVAAALRAAGADVTFITQVDVGHTIDLPKYGPEILAWLHKQAEDKRLIEWMRKAKAADPANLPEAIKHYKIIAATASTDPLVTQAEARLAEIEKQATDRLDAAQKAIAAKQYAQAMDLLRALRREYEGTQPAIEAAVKLKQLQDDPAVAQAFREAEASARAQRAATELEHAQKLLDAKDYVAGVAALDGIAKAYPDTPAATEAQAKAASLRADKAIGAQIREAAAARECKGLLSLARNLIASHRPDAARPYLQKIITNYPGTSYAEEAAKLKQDTAP